MSEPFPRRQHIVCTDGFRMSVQAGDGLYSSPRKDGAFSYTDVEVGFPSEVEELLMPYAELLNQYNPETDEWDIPADPTESVYPYTPASVILAVIAKHGGMVSGELPPLKMTGGEEE